MSLQDFLKTKQNLKGFKEEPDHEIIGLDFNIITQEHTNGVQLADSCMIEEMKKNFVWKRGFQNCFTGFPNSGKSQFCLFVMTVKTMLSKWKWVVWSPEMKSANFVDNKVKVHYNDLAYEIMATCSGKTPYKHIHEKYKVPMMTLEEKQEWIEWIKQYFIFIDPTNKKIDDIYNLLIRIYDDQGFDGVLIDPYKNIDSSDISREDKFLHKVFDDFKDLAVRTNSVMNWIAHPKSGVQRIVTTKDGDKLAVCNQYMLSGGAAWDNSMDGIYSIQRPFELEDINDSRVHFHNLKQRKQELTCSRGVVEDIDFNIKTRRYIFNLNDPLGYSVPTQLERFPEVESNFERPPF